ncbi:hypothetical protein WPS_34380 [Vulcanimicrobium alpinum]|uniref:ATP synthase subunit b n=1 Tax=Vulcanimicrobium alpinum TaxID=3016050 RepID=A0AAN1XZB3_UNVUL|nr:ATP synthase F0 subunit B [Vulcanimicrobium alpinum]BDE08162.1 hypothetical protein WPS_34380 [Vulcanimicrobium alpinum]
MLSIDGTLIVQLVNFVVFLAILNAIFFKPVGAAIAKRRAYIDGLKHDIEQLQGDAKSIRTTAEGRRAAARREADDVLAKARTAASAETDAIIVAAQGKASEIVTKAHADVATELDAARANEPQLIDALANEMLSRAIGGAA